MPDTHEWSQAAVASEREARRVDAASRLRRIQFERDPSLLAGRKLRMFRLLKATDGTLDQSTRVPHRRDARLERKFVCYMWQG